MNEQPGQLLDSPFLRIKLLEGAGDLDADVHGIAASAIGNSDCDSAAFRAGKNVFAWSKSQRLEANTRQVRRCEFRGKTEVVNVGGAHDFKWSIGSAANAHIAKFEQPNTRIQCG